MSFREKKILFQRGFPQSGSFWVLKTSHDIDILSQDLSEFPLTLDSNVYAFSTKREVKYLFSYKYICKVTNFNSDIF